MPISPATPLVLGSASPRRRTILEAMRLPLRVVSADIDEGVVESENAADYLERVVDAKLQAVAGRLTGRFAAVVVADTIVVCDDEILVKPVDVADAARLVGRLAGRTHTVFTRYAFASSDAPSIAVGVRTVESKVTMRRADRDEVERYAATGEGLDKAGAYAIQGIGAFLVERIDGSYTNVVGLPACELIGDLRDRGLLGAFP